MASAFAEYSVAAGLLFAACGGREGVPASPPPAAEDSAPVHSAAPPPRAADAGSGAAISEVEARTLLFDRFRQAELRILRDYRLATAAGEVTLDGFDPERGIGYEYIAVEERDVDPSAAERVALGAMTGVRVLLVEAGSADRVAAAADAFLGAPAP